MEEGGSAHRTSHAMSNLPAALAKCETKVTAKVKSHGESETHQSVGSRFRPSSVQPAVVLLSCLSPFIISS